MDCSYRLDLLVDSAVIVEVKSVASVLPIHQAQLLTYLRLIDLPVGLVINFQVERLVDGVKRVINAQSSAMKSAAVRLRSLRCSCETVSSVSFRCSLPSIKTLHPRLPICDPRAPL